MVEDDPAPSTTDGPRTFADVLGQSEAVERLKALAAIAAVRPVPHMLIVGPDGSGKRTLARVLANECSANLVTAEATAIARTVDLMGILTNLGYGDFFFLEAVSGLPHPVEELLIPVLRNNRVEFVIDKGVHARMLHYELRHFTCIGSVERLGDVSAKLRPLFPVVVPLQPYAVDSLAELAIRRARFLGADI